MLAKALLNGEISEHAVVERASLTLGREWRWLEPLARRFVARFGTAPVRPKQREVVLFLLRDRSFRRANRKQGKALKVEHWMTGQAVMQPGFDARGWDLPVIEAAGDLANWFEITPAELEWFGDLKGLCSKTVEPKLQHYHYKVLAKRRNGFRLIEAPKLRLKRLQRRILHGILDKIPAHPAAHGFVSARSIRSFAAPHVGREVVLRMDLNDFFPTVSGVRVQALFRTAGYPERVADLLGGICTNTVPAKLWRNSPLSSSPGEMWEAQQLYGTPHLPQGAPTSPALANLCAYRMDCRLTALARWAGAEYTRYADDLVFSGDTLFAERMDRFLIYVAAIALEEGFSVQHRKTRIMTQGGRQRVAGMITNQRLNVNRSDYDRLKAILTNCVRHGPDTQNRDNHPAFRHHLEGRIAFVAMVNPDKANRLQAIFQQIDWP